MSNYCTYLDAQRLLQMTYSTTSKPTIADVTEICTQVTGEIDSYLAGIGVSTQPVTTGLLSMFKNYASMGVAGMVLMTYSINFDSVIGSRADYFLTQYREFLDRLLTMRDMIYKIEGLSGDNILSSDVIDGTNAETDIDRLGFEIDV